MAILPIGGQQLPIAPRDGQADVNPLIQRPGAIVRRNGEPPPPPPAEPQRESIKTRIVKDTARIESRRIDDARDGTLPQPLNPVKGVINITV